MARVTVDVPLTAMERSVIIDALKVQKRNVNTMSSLRPAEKVAWLVEIDNCIAKMEGNDVQVRHSENA